MEARSRGWKRCCGSCRKAILTLSFQVGSKMRTSDAQLRIRESRDSGSGTNGPSRNVKARIGEIIRVTDTFDFVVVGAGSGGCTVAGRLSEDPQTSVALLDA